MCLSRCSAAHSLLPLVAASLVVACDRIPTAMPPSAVASDAQLTLHGGTADVALTASATILQNGDSWTLDKTGSLSGSTVTWTITATKTTVVNGQLLIEGQVTLTNSGDGPATIGNVVVTLQSRANNKWVTTSSDIANATQGDAATTASIHAPASSENLGTFTENSASGALEFRDATTNAVLALVPQVVLGAGESRSLLFSAAFDNSDAALQLTAGTPIRAEVIVSFGNATVNGNSTANVDINGNGAIDADEARVRSVSSRLTLPVPAAAPGGTVTLTDGLEDITVTGDVTFSNAQFTLGATSGTVTATVNGGTDGGSIANCAHLTTADQSLDLESCSTVAVAAVPPGCTPGALGCGWSNGDMTTAAQNSWGDPTSIVASLLGANFTSVFGASIVIGGTITATFTDALAVLNYLPATGPAGPLIGNVQDPSTTSSGELAGEVLALKLNVDFSAASVLTSAVPLGNLRICNFSLLPAINGQTVSQFLATANILLGGGAAPFGPSSAASVARLINSAFVGGAPSSFAQASLVAGPSCGWQPGDMITYTQTSWGTPATTAGGLLDANFSTVHGAAVIIGGAFKATFTSAAAVFNYLPATGPAASLTGNVQNPLTTSSGEFAGEVLALQLNVDYSGASLLASIVPLGSLRFCTFADVPSLNGQTVGQFLTTANHVLGGGSAVLDASTIAAVARRINAAFIDGAPSTFAQATLVAGSCT